MSDLSEFDRLPLGRIVRVLEKELEPFQLLPTGELPDDWENGTQNVYRRFDEQFEGRPDYKFWRTSLVPHFATGRRWLDQPEGPFVSTTGNPLKDFGWICAESDDPIVLWSAITIATTLMDESRAIRPAARDQKALTAFSDRLYGRLRYELDPLPDCRASCGIAAAYFLIAHERFHYKLGFVISESECTDFVDLIERWLRVSDPLWVPGQKLNLSAVQTERRGRYRLRPGHDAHEFSLLVRNLAILTPILTRCVAEINRETNTLLTRAYQYSLTAWLTSRSRRIDETLHQKKIGKFHEGGGRSKRRAALLKELECHWNASLAARNAGEYLQSAKLLYILYRIVPNEFIHDPAVEKEIIGRKITIRYLKEAGLEIDPRFFEDNSTSEKQSEIEEFAAAFWEIWRASLGVAPRIELPQGENQNPFLLRLHRDQQTLPDWTTLLNASDIPGGEHTPDHYLLTIMKGLADAGFPASPEALSAAFRLALEYGYVRSAGKILGRAVRRNEFPIDAKLLMDFVHSVKRCTQLDPFGMRYERIAEWRQLLVDASLKLIGEHGSSNWLTADERMWLHELLLNRTHVHHRSLSLENTRRLYQKAIGVYEVEDLREFYDKEHDLLRRYPGIANVETIKAFCARYRTSELGAPVAISSVRLGEFVSVVGIGQDGASTEDVLVGDLDAAIQRLQADSAHWFGMADVPVDEQIHWPNAFRAICRSIAKVAASCDPNSKVIMLSCDWFVAQFPWQHLFQAEGFDYLIAVVPNFSSIGLDRRDRPQQRDLRLELSTEKDTTISEANGAVRYAIAGVDWKGSSVCIVVGHGSKAPEGALPCVRIGPLPEDQLGTSDDWMSVLDSRIVVLHCCHGGVPTPMVMQELGGLVGLASSLATESLLAPVAEVHPVAVAELQSCLCSEGGSRELGVQYLRAIKNVPECSLYNLYGNPYETLAAPAAESCGEAKIEFVPLV